MERLSILKRYSSKMSTDTIDTLIAKMSVFFVYSILKILSINFPTVAGRCYLSKLIAVR